MGSSRFDAVIEVAFRLTRLAVAVAAIVWLGLTAWEHFG